MDSIPSRPVGKSHVCALLTCFNRLEKTLASLQSLELSAAEARLTLSAILVDDGSTDGTAEAVRQQFSWVQVHESQGDLYWCRGMHLAFELATVQNPDYYLWLNDDTIVMPHALGSLLHTALERANLIAAPVIVVGSCHDSRSQGHTYGGVKLASRWVRTRFKKVRPLDQVQALDTFDGNLVLVSREAAQRTGNLDDSFEHAMGDYDYGLRARRAGVACWLAPGWHATCDDNPSTNTFRDRSLALSRRWRLMTSRKGLPVRSWWRFNRRHGGPLWLATFIWPYLRVTLEGLSPVRSAPPS